MTHRLFATKQEGQQVKHCCPSAFSNLLARGYNFSTPHQQSFFRPASQCFREVIDQTVRNPSRSVTAAFLAVSVCIGC
jgi:hypothetical protein